MTSQILLNQLCTILYNVNIDYKKGWELPSFYLLRTCDEKFLAWNELFMQYFWSNNYTLYTNKTLKLAIKRLNHWSLSCWCLVTEKYNHTGLMYAMKTYFYIVSEDERIECFSVRSVVLVDQSWMFIFLTKN